MSYQLIHSTTTERYGPDQLAGVYVYRCPNGEAAALRDSFHGMLMPGGSGLFEARAVRVRVDRDGFGEKGFSRITVIFRSVRRPDTATIRSGSIVVTPTRPKTDLDGKHLWGDDGDGVHTWETIQGQAVGGLASEVIVIETAETNLDLVTPRNWLNCINSGFLSTLGAGPGILWFYRLVYRKDSYARLWYKDYYFRVCPERDASGNILSWNDCTRAQIGAWITADLPRYTYDPDVSPPTITVAGTTKPVRIRIPGYAISNDQLALVEPEKRRLFHVANFSGLDSKIVL